MSSRGARRSRTRASARIPEGVYITVLIGPSDIHALLLPPNDHEAWFELRIHGVLMFMYAFTKTSLANALADVADRDECLVAVTVDKIMSVCHKSKVADLHLSIRLRIMNHWTHAKVIVIDDYLVVVISRL